MAGSNSSGRPAATEADNVDSTADLARVLRIAGTYNLKTDEAREVTVREANDFRYDPSDFSAFAQPNTSPTPGFYAVQHPSRSVQPARLAAHQVPYPAR